MDLESSVELLRRVRSGDPDALNVLLGRYVAPLRRWAHGRLPRYARELSDTQDIVQDALLRALRHVERFDPVGPAALHCYLRQAVMNRIRDELRRAKRHPAPFELDDRVADVAASPLERAIGKEALDAYTAALAQLDAEEQEIIVARLECGYTHDEIAAMFEKPTAAAARMAVRRAVLKLAGLMCVTGSVREQSV
jgi:RNA polymerase sigma-70 factor (ECF subfamily)